MPRQPKVKTPLTIADLPAPSTDRWVIRRKAEVLAAVHGGLVSLEDVCRRYMLTVEEFLSWQYASDRHGLAGLRTTRIRQYRPGNFPLWPLSRGKGGSPTA
jgi:hypothetical protein